MNKSTRNILCVTLLCTSFASAEKSADQINQSFLKTAQQYENKAVSATRNGNAHNASIYQKLAAIKRDAASANGKYDWTEYHKLKGQLDYKETPSADAKGLKKPHKSKEVETYSLEGAAKKYDDLAKKSTQSGQAEQASIYRRMAAIKREASATGGNYDWTEYHALEAQLKKL